ISSLIFEYLIKNDIPTHFIKKISENEELVKKVKIFPLEIVTRNVSAGHFSTRYGVEEGKKFNKPVEEMYFKRDELDDQFINESQALALEIATKDDLTRSWHLFKQSEMKLVDFKLEFGNLADGTLVLADEFSPDNCRLWDLEDNRHLDKDVYRRNIGDLTPVYEEVLNRLKKVLNK